MLMILWALGLLDGLDAGGGIVVSYDPITPHVRIGPALAPSVTFKPRGR